MTSYLPEALAVVQDQPPPAYILPAAEFIAYLFVGGKISKAQLLVQGHAAVVGQVEEVGF